VHTAARIKMPLCGPKLSLVGCVLSAWGVAQLALMGVFFWMNSVALVEDIPLEAKYTSRDELIRDMDAGFQQNALNCWVAALLYLVTLLFSVSQFYLNNRQTYSV